MILPISERNLLLAISVGVAVSTLFESRSAGLIVCGGFLLGFLQTDETVSSTVATP